MRRHKVRGCSVIAVIQLEQNKDFLEHVCGKTSALCEVHGARTLILPSISFRDLNEAVSMPLSLQDPN